MFSFTEIIHIFANMESIISFLYEMNDKYRKSCNIETPHTTDLCNYKCKKYLFLKVIIKKMVNDDLNKVKILKFRRYIEEFTTTFDKLFFEYISSE